MTATQRDPAGCGPREGGAHLAFAPTLEGCRPLFPRELLDTGGWERLLDRARLLPRSVLDTHFGFEFHLGEPSPDADLFVVVRPGSDLARHYIGEGARSEPGSAAAALGAGLREQATNPDSYLASSVGGLVLEYDLAGLAPHRRPPPPGVFLSPRRGPSGPRGVPFEHRDPAGLIAALAVAVGWSGREEMLGTVERAFAALPERGFVFQAGALPARSPRAFRILLGGVAGRAGSRPAGAGGVARLDGCGGGRARRRGRLRRPRRREPGRDRTGAGSAPRPRAVPPSDVVRGRSHGVASLHRPSRGEGLVPSRESRGPAALAGDRTAARRRGGPPRSPGHQPRQGRRRTGRPDGGEGLRRHGGSPLRIETPPGSSAAAGMTAADVSAPSPPPVASIRAALHAPRRSRSSGLGGGGAGGFHPTEPLARARRKPHRAHASETRVAARSASSLGCPRPHRHPFRSGSFPHRKRLEGDEDPLQGRPAWTPEPKP